MGDSFLLLAKELRLKGLEGSSEEKAPEYPEESFNNDIKNYEDLNQRQNIPQKAISTANLEYESNTFDGSLITYQHKQKLNSIIEPDTMARIESLIEKQGGGYSCKNCGHTSRNLGHMREHVEKHI